MPLLQLNDSVLLVIDAQPGFYRERPDVDGESLTTFLERAAWVAALAAALGVPIVVTVERPARNGDTAEGIKRFLGPNDPVFAKETFAATMDLGIACELDRLARRTAVVVGMETDVCVAQSAIGLRDLGFRVAAISDAVFAPGEAHHHGLERLRGCGAELMSAKVLFYEWLPSLEAVQSFKREHPELARPPGFRL
jgi:nicotinamidase-related amidase